jgi:DNA-binding GntR family transcriptional regulator
MKSTIPESGVPIAKLADSGAPDRAEPSLHGEILSRLRDYVVEGNIPDGGRVPERQLCEMFGISRTPLREALKVLAAEGLIELLPNRGARVRQLGKRDLEELFDVMGGLESLAGRLACETVTDEEIAEIERLHYEMYGHYLHRDMHNYFQANQRIHERIVAASRNETLRTTYTNLAGRIRQLRPRTATLDRGHARARSDPGRTAAPGRQRARRHPVPALAKQADRRSRAPQRGVRGGDRRSHRRLALGTL